MVPRVYAAYDITGDGKTVVKGGWGRFAQERGTDELSAANANVALTAPFLWHDLNGNKRWEPGESNLDPNGPDFIGTTVQFGGATSYAVPNPNEKTPMSDQFSLSVEREIIANFRRTWNRDLFPLLRSVPCAEQSAAVRGVQHSYQKP
jgi:hypothetical protein